MKTNWIYLGVIGIILIAAIAVLGTINYEGTAEGFRWANEDDGFYHDGGMDCPECLENLERWDSLTVDSLLNDYDTTVQDGTMIKE
jgi:hypothetical protein